MIVPVIIMMTMIVMLIIVVLIVKMVITGSSSSTFERLHVNSMALTKSVPVLLKFPLGSALRLNLIS